MSLRVRVLPEAEADLTEAFLWYEETQQGLGTRFLGAVREALNQVASHPLASRPLHDEIRRVLTDRFPYGLFYVVEGDDVVVLGCFHARRDPTVWKERHRHDDDA